MHVNIDCVRCMHDYIYISCMLHAWKGSTVISDRRKTNFETKQGNFEGQIRVIKSQRFGPKCTGKCIHVMLPHNCPFYLNQ